MPTFSTRRLNQTGDGALGSKLSSERKTATIAPSDILIGVAAPASAKDSDLACAIGSVKVKLRAPAISRAAPRILNAYPRSGFTAMSKIVSLICSNSIAS